jgi:hypothetical protein
MPNNDTVQEEGKKGMGLNKRTTNDFEGWQTKSNKKKNKEVQN